MLRAMVVRGVCCHWISRPGKPFMATFGAERVTVLCNVSTKPCMLACGVMIGRQKQPAALTSEKGYSSGKHTEG
jgi:hypothetical protein